MTKRRQEFRRKRMRKVVAFSQVFGMKAVAAVSDSRKERDNAEATKVEYRL